MQDRIIETERQAFSIPEFCFRNGISNSSYHKFRAQGRGPREMRLGRVIRISIEAEADWRRSRELPDETEARLIQREREVRLRHARKGVDSPKHVSKRNKAGA